MSVQQIICPECDAKLSSRAGFTAGQKLRCPKCEAVFAVTAANRESPVEMEMDEEDEPRPAKKKKPVVVEEDEDERPRKKKKKGKKSEDDEGSYTNSPVRFIILGVLVVTMLVMGFFLYKKFTAPPLPDIIVPAKPVPGED